MNADVYRGPWGGARCRDSIAQTQHPCDCAEGDILSWVEKQRVAWVKTSMLNYNFQVCVRLLTSTWTSWRMFLIIAVQRKWLPSFVRQYRCVN